MKRFALLCILSVLVFFCEAAFAAVTITPKRLNCPDTAVGSSSACTNLEVNNNNTFQVTVDSIVVGNTEDFTVDYSACLKLLEPRETCEITVQFNPTLGRDFETSLTVNYKKDTKSYKVSSDIFGRGLAPIVSLSTDTAAFGEQTINTSAWQYVTMKNIGSATLNISTISIPLGSAFRVTTDCMDTLAASAICTIQIFFEPTAVRSYVSTVSIYDDADDSPQKIELSGTGVAAATPDVNLDKKVIDFGDKELNSTNTSTVTVKNTGTVALTIANISDPSSPYTQSNDCGAGLLPDASCTITVTFQPTTAGAFSSTIILTDNASDSPQTVTLKGKGVSPNPVLQPDVIEFGNQTIGKTSATREVVLINSGTSTLTISSISVSSTVFTETHTCGSTLEPKQSCIIDVTFTPTAEGFVGGALSVSQPSGLAETTFLFGYGITGPDVDIVPSLHDFGSVDVGDTSQPQEFSVKNTGEGELSIYSITVNSDFAQTNDCPSILEEGEYCTITGTFLPQVGGNFFGLLSIADNATGSPHVANLWGYGTSSDLTLIPAGIDFGDQTTGKSSLAHEVRVLNSGNAAITITSIASDNSLFTQTNDCGASLAPTAYCTISIIFSPTTTGAVTGSVVITDSASGSPHNIDLMGTGIDPVYPDLDISPNFWDFGSVLVGQTSATKALTVKNTGAVAVTISSITVNSEFAQTNDCGTSLAEGQTCTITVTFSPEASGTFNGTVRILDNTPAGYQTASLKGSGVHSGDISVSLSTTTVNFGNVIINTKSDPKSVVVTNSGTDALTIGEVSLTGSDSRYFSKNTNCQERTLDVGKSCIIDVTFNTTSYGAKTALIKIYDDAGDSPQKVTVSGTGGANTYNCSLNNSKGAGNSATTLGFLLLILAVIFAARYRCYVRI